MTEDVKKRRLNLLKHNLQRTTTAQEDYLSSLIDKAESQLEYYGVTDDDSKYYEFAIIDLASFYFNKRNSDQDFSPMIMREIKDLIIKQAAKK